MNTAETTDKLVDYKNSRMLVDTQRISMKVQTQCYGLFNAIQRL